MKNRLLNLFLATLCLISTSVQAQITDTTDYNFGIWQYLGAPLKKTQFPEIEGRLQNFFWKDLEIAPDVWNWVQFDSIIADKVKDSLPLIYMVYTKDDAPEWLYTNGVPKVDETDAAGNITGYSPYYMDPDYKFFFKRMITRVREHVETMPDSVRRYIVGVQACFGSTGDYISYKGTVDVAYRITAPQFFALFQEFSTKYYDEYKNTNPKITVIHNPKNNGPEQLSWVLTNCPGGWIKTGSLGKGFQLNDEKTKNSWLYNPLNLPQSGSYIRSRCEIISDALYAGWWTKKPYQNMFAIMCYGVYWGLDWTNQGYDQIIDTRYDPAFHFYNKYAGEKDPLKAGHAMSALKDVLDAADGTRFPAATYGTIAKTNATRYNNIALAYQAYGAKLEDPASAVLTEDGNTLATGTNDVGWDLLPGNYERWLRQLTPNSTSVGYWNIESADTTTVYGRFGRGFELATGKDRLNFDVDSNFLGYAPLNSQYPVIIEVTYLDRGFGSWSIVYDGADSTDKTATTITNTNTNLWKTVAITINDAYFGNRGLDGTDFSIRNAGNEDVIFTLVELTRSSSRNFYVGLFASPVQPIADVCVSDSSAAQYFTLTGSFLNGSDVVVGPLPGYSFALSADGTYSDSLVISNYGAQFNLTLYTKLSAATPGIYAGNVPINGGGFSTNLNLSGQVVDSRPEINANISGITCNNARNAAIDLVLTGGTGPFTYSWVNDLNGQKPTDEDIDSLPPATYTVTVSSYAGCKTTASYTITQPDVLVAAISSDTMICKNTTTNVYVSATGGTLPYTGTGTYNVGPGYIAYMVTDANGCTDVAGMVVENATLTPPLKPVEITGAAADETGLCTGGDFAYEIAPVSNATFYTWTLPAGTSISSASADSTQIMLNAPAGFSSGILSVSAGNVCGTSLATTKVLNGYPAKPGTITGINTILPSTQGLVYSVPAVAGVTYNWTVPAGASIVAGQGTSSITVNWGAISGNVNVKAQNDCGISLSTILSVTVASGVFVTSVETLPAFETVCINGLSAAQSFNLSATGLSGEDVVVGPVTGFKFSPALNGQYRDTLVYSDYGTSLNRVVYVKFSPVAPESYNVAIPISGGAGVPTAVNVSGSAVNSSPLLSANINNITCFGLKNGSIDLVVADGVGPFTYNWIGGGATATYDPSAEDINGLAPLTYTVTVGSYAGCTTTASFTVTQPDPLDVVLTADTMYCKNSTTSVYVSGTGGTLPYSGTGTFTGVSFGTSLYTITDANGCTDSKAIFVPNGVNLPPLKPGTISAPDADAKGVCGGGIFNFSIDPVATATSYTWIVPASGSFSPANSANTSIALTLPAGISTDTVRVIASNVCGSSPAQTKLIIAVPGKPAAVSGPAAVLPSQQGVVYSVVPAVEGIQYKWTVPSGATIVSGLNTPSITVNFGTNGGNINVRAQNACGNSTATILAVSVSTGIFTTSVGAISDFDTTCVNGLSAAKSFTFSATGLSGSAVVVGPVPGFKFSKTAGGAYTDSLIYTGYGTALSNQNVFVRFNPSQLDLTSGAAVIRGGGTPNTASVALSGYAVISSPILTGVVTDVTCNGLANGAVDLTLNGGTGPFTYSWVGPGTFNKTVEDAVGLSATNYTVNVGSYAGCTTSATFTINQPSVVVVSVSADPMLCKNSTTAVYVSATGGVAPYTGTGVFSAPSGTSTYTVTDANGCAKTGGISIANGTGLPPAKPVTITSTAADASGVCGGGSFDYTVSPVANATSYTWTAPANCSIVSTSPDGLTATILVPAGFTSDSIRVRANNTCGSSANLAKLVTAIPAKPAAISGPASVLPGQTVTYSVTATPGVTYTWSAPVSVSILSGQNTSNVTVRWGLTSGNITVRAVNACGSTANTSLGVGVISNTFASSVATLPAYDTLCVNSSSASKSFTLTAVGLNGNTVTVGPLAGFTFSTSNSGSYTNTLALNGYGTSLNVNIFVKYNPTVTGTTSGIIPVSGGGAPAAQLVSVTGNAVNSRPTLSAVVTNITCNGAKNGAIDLSVDGGTGPFTYQWVGTGSFDKTVQDISGLSPVTYTVTVGSYAGCTTTGSYQVTQPATLVASLTADPMLCRNSTTNVYVNATGGTLPYTGTGTVTGVAAGTYSYTVTDSKGCVSTKSIIVANGTGTPPAAPGAISSTLADASGVCGTGPFAYSIAAVNNATSYNWTLPSGTTIVSGAGTTSISLEPLAGFTTGTLGVAAVNACGISGASGKAINASPAKPGAVSGPAAVLKQQSGIVYSVPEVAGLTYTWTVPASVTILSGQGTNTLTIKWGNANTGNISVRAVNSCGQSAASSIAVSATTAIAPSKLAGQESLGFNTAKAFTVYPNPAKDYAYFTFDAGAEYRYTIDIMDISGRQVIRQTGMANKGSNVVRLNVHGLANGMYMVSLVNEQGERKTVKLVKE